MGEEAEAQTVRLSGEDRKLLTEIYKVLIEIKEALQTKPPTPVKPTLAPSQALEEVRTALSGIENLEIKETYEGIIIKPIKFLGRENFRKVAQIVREKGGRLVGAGREAHWIIRKQAR